MKSSTTCARRIRRQRGFSVLEILIATVLISLLVASGLYYANVGDRAATVDIVASQAAIVVRFPEALMTMYAQKRTLEDVTAAELVGTGSVRDGSPVTWEVADGDDAPTADTLSVKMTFDEESQAAAIKSYLEDNIDTTMVDQVEVDEDDASILTVRYSIR